MEPRAAPFHPEARFSDALESSSPNQRGGRSSPMPHQPDTRVPFPTRNGKGDSNLRHRSRHSTDTHDWESGVFIYGGGGDSSAEAPRHVQQQFGMDGWRGVEGPSPTALKPPPPPKHRSPEAPLDSNPHPDGDDMEDYMTEEELEEALRNHYDEVYMGGFGWDGAAEGDEEGFANPLKSSLLRRGREGNHPPVTALHRPEAAPVTAFRRKKAPTSSMVGIPPQTAINLGRAAARGQRDSDALPPTPPRTGAQPPSSLSHATETSLMKKKHARLHDLCRQRGVVKDGSSKDWTKREMVKALMKWRLENAKRPDSTLDDLHLVSESESEPTSTSSQEDASFDRSTDTAEDDDHHDLDLSYYVHHVGSPANLPLRLPTPMGAPQLAKVEESEEDRFRDAEGDEEAQTATEQPTPPASEFTSSLPSSEQSRLTADSPEGHDTPHAKKTLRAPLGHVAGANGATSKSTRGRTATIRDRVGWNEWETIRSQVKASRPALPDDFLQPLKPREPRSPESPSGEEDAAPKAGGGGTPRPAEKERRHHKRHHTAETPRTSDGSSSVPSSLAQSVRQHPPPVPLLDDPTQSRKRRSIRLVGTKASSQGGSKYGDDVAGNIATSVVRIGGSPTGVVSPTTMRGGAAAAQTSRAVGNLSQMNLLHNAVGPLSPPASEEALSAGPSAGPAVRPANSSHFDSKMLGSNGMRSASSDSIESFEDEEEERAAGEDENLDVLLDLEDLKLADKEIPAEKLVREEKIGSGTFKDVYMGRCRSFRVAICDLRNRLTDLDIKELGLLRDLRHPNIVRFIGVSVGETIPCTIVTELCRNGDAYNYIRRIPCPPFYQILTMLLDAARGIEYLHNRTPSVVHRDLKSPNLLITSNGTAKITDFGLARVKRNVLSMCATTCGTLNWQAPEIWQEKPKYNHSIDIYGLGLVFWELLYWPFKDKHYPYQGMNEFVIYAEVGKNGRRPNVASIKRKWGREITALVERMWAHQPSSRPTITEVVRILNAMVLQERERSWAAPPSA